MDRRFSIPYFITLAGIPVAAGLRIWSLNTAVDNLGMPVMHRSICWRCSARCVPPAGKPGRGR